MSIETPLMPFWIWLSFPDLPTARASLGGTLVMGAVVFDLIGSGRMRAPRPRSSELAP